MKTARTSALLARFLSVGGLGFLVDAGIFQVLFMLGYGAIVPRVVSASAAITLTWYLNRHLVFRTALKSRRGPEYLRYLAVQTAGLAVNFGVYLLMLASIETIRTIPIIALCAGALAAIAFNFLGARYWAFRAGAAKG